MGDDWFVQSDQFKNGKDVERFLDDFFGDEFDIVQTSKYQERVLCLGDRIFSKGEDIYFVEYKSGIQTYYTGNIFLETVSVDGPCTPGWVYTCQADWILYAALLNKMILVFRPEHLRQKIAELKTKFPERATSKSQSKGYNTHGIVIPFAYAQKLASKIIGVADDGR